MPMMIEKRIRSGICHAIYRYAKVNKNFNEKLYSKHWIIISHEFRCKQFE